MFCAAIGRGAAGTEVPADGLGSDAGALPSADQAAARRETPAILKGLKEVTAERILKTLRQNLPRLVPEDAGSAGGCRARCTRSRTTASGSARFISSIFTVRKAPGETGLHA
jgi:hypothetical protein